MKNVRYTWMPTSDGTMQPNYLDVDSVVEALSSIYELKQAKGYQPGIGISKDGEEIYDEAALSRAIGKMEDLIYGMGMSLDKASEKVAKDDGHFD